MNFRPFPENFPGQYLKLHSTYPPDLLKGSYFAPKNFPPKHLRNLNGQRSASPGNFITGSSNLDCISARRLFWRDIKEFGISKQFFICGFWGENFQLVRETLIGGVKTAFYVFRKAIWGITFLEESNFSFLGRIRESWEFMGKIFRQYW